MSLTADQLQLGLLPAAQPPVFIIPPAWACVEMMGIGRVFVSADIRLRPVPLHTWLRMLGVLP